ncbi:MAG: sulfite exporter TauE/SafE family protein [Oscillospiraceae bacterium]
MRYRRRRWPPERRSSWTAGSDSLTSAKSPCYTPEVFAASSGSWASGAVSMLAFGAGTCVFMLLFGLLGTFLPKRYNKYLLKGSTILIVALGLILMTKSIRLLA